MRIWPCSPRTECLRPPWRFAWRDRLASGGFGFLFSHRKNNDQIWERQQCNQKVRVETIEHIENFAYCWKEGYRASRFVHRLIYGDEFIRKIQQVDRKEITWEWLQDFTVSGGYLQWSVELFHRNGRSCDVEEEDYFLQLRREYLRDCFRKKDHRLSKLSQFYNLILPEKEARDLYDAAFFYTE